MTANRSRSRRPGLTIVESIVVAGLISSVFLLVIGLIPSFKLSNRRAGMELQASTIAQSTLEDLRAADFSTVATSSPPLPTVVDNVKYTRTITVTPSAGGISKSVKVVVKWTWREKDYQVSREGIICHVPRG